MDEYDIGKAFEAIEKELISSMIRNMDRHKAEETDKGIEWSQWQAEQLKSLEQYKTRNQKKYKTRFADINRQIDALIRTARESGGMDQEIEILEAVKNGFKGCKKTADAMTAQFFRTNDRKLEALIKATVDDMKKAETAILRMANDKYRQAIFHAQVYANTGAGTYEKAVDMATKDMLSAGLNCVEYSNGARHALADYADMAVRTACKRAYLTGEGEKRKEWGISTVIMNKRGNPCLKCLPWVGKIMIDDVWSGGKRSDGPYPLMSTAVAAGLYHPRCRDSHTTYFEGISTPPDNQFTKKEIQDIEKENSKEEERKYARRQADKFDRMAKYSLDGENRRQYALRSHEWNREATQRFNDYKELENYLRKTYNGTIDEDVKKLDIKQVSQTLTEFETVMNDFPKAREFFSGINTCERGKAAFAPNGELALNPKIYKSLDRSLIGAGYHEAGHLLELTLIRNENPNLPVEDIYNLYKKGGYADDIVSMAYQRIGTGRTLKELRSEISGYSLKDCSETIAEAVADYYMNGYNASILSRQIVKVLERRME